MHTQKRFFARFFCTVGQNYVGANIVSDTPSRKFCTMFKFKDIIFILKKTLLFLPGLSTGN